MNVLNVVDAWMADEVVAQLAAEGPWDMVLWPFQTMLESDVLSPTRAAVAAKTLPAEWFEQLRALNPRYVVPSACQFVQEPWSWYNHAMFPVTYAQFARDVLAALPSVSVLRLNPGVSVELDAEGVRPASALSWVIPVGEQDVDFDYAPARAVPSTAAIARHFPALSTGETARVLRFCDVELLDIYQEMELSLDSYFSAQRGWRLSLHDNNGGVLQYHYRIEGDAIERVTTAACPLAWTTDVPIAKVYAALERGESLTSMYVRINDERFDEATEADIAAADLIDDPLIRCLFNGAVGGYQAAQLERILARQTTGY